MQRLTFILLPYLESAGGWQEKYSGSFSVGLENWKSLACAQGIAIFEPHNEKTGFLPMRKQRHRSAVQLRMLDVATFMLTHIPSLMENDSNGKPHHQGHFICKIIVNRLPKSYI